MAALGFLKKKAELLWLDTIHNSFKTMKGKGYIQQKKARLYHCIKCITSVHGYLGPEQQKKA